MSTKGTSSLPLSEFQHISKQQSSNSTGHWCGSQYRGAGKCVLEETLESASTSHSVPQENTQAQSLHQRSLQCPMTVCSHWRLKTPEKGKHIRKLLICMGKMRKGSGWESLRQQSKIVTLGVCKGMETERFQKGDWNFFKKRIGR